MPDIRRPSLKTAESPQLRPPISGVAFALRPRLLASGYLLSISPNNLHADPQLNVYQRSATGSAVRTPGVFSSPAPDVRGGFSPLTPAAGFPERFGTNADLPTPTSEVPPYGPPGNHKPEVSENWRDAHGHHTSG